MWIAFAFTVASKTSNTFCPAVNSTVTGARIHPSSGTSSTFSGSSSSKCSRIVAQLMLIVHVSGTSVAAGASCSGSSSIGARTSGSCAVSSFSSGSTVSGCSSIAASAASSFVGSSATGASSGFTASCAGSAAISDAAVSSCTISVFALQAHSPSSSTARTSASARRPNSFIYTSPAAASRFQTICATSQRQMASPGLSSVRSDSRILCSAQNASASFA